MKIPNNLLPIYVMENGFGKKGSLNHHTLYSTGNDLIYLCNISKDKLICHESSEYDSLELANYLAFCANNFPRVIELLKECLEEYSDHSLKNQIQEFLNKIENE